MKNSLEYGHAFYNLRAYQSARDKDNTDWGQWSREDPLVEPAWKKIVLRAIVRNILPLRTIEELSQDGDPYDYNPFDESNGWRE